MMLDGDGGRRFHFSVFLGIHVAFVLGAVMAHHRVRENVSAGYVYLVIGELRHARFIALRRSAVGSRRPLHIRPDPAPRIRRRGWRRSALILALIGAGSKAGLVPLHVLAAARPSAAPSHVSALMSG